MITVSSLTTRGNVVYVDVRTRILQAAADLLAASAAADVSTRAVCEAAGVGAPALYRQFGDKEGLLAAVVDYGFGQYLAAKRALPPSEDPVQDVRDGWDNHVAFAVKHPNYYKLMFSPGLSAPPGAAAEAHDLLLQALERCAAAGRLTVSPQTAAQMVMSANTGVALALLYRPAIYLDHEFSTRVRDAVVDAITTAAGRPERPAANPIGTTAATLGAQLREQPATATSLTPAETALLQQWLTHLADTAAGETHRGDIHAHQ